MHLIFVSKRYREDVLLPPLITGNRAQSDLAERVGVEINELMLTAEAPEPGSVAQFDDRIFKTSVSPKRRGC